MDKEIKDYALGRFLYILSFYKSLNHTTCHSTFSYVTWLFPSRYWILVKCYLAKSSLIKINKGKWFSSFFSSFVLYVCPTRNSTTGLSFIVWCRNMAIWYRHNLCICLKKFLINWLQSQYLSFFSIRNWCDDFVLHKQSLKLLNCWDIVFIRQLPYVWQHFANSVWKCIYGSVRNCQPYEWQGTQCERASTERTVEK